MVRLHAVSLIPFALMLGILMPVPAQDENPTPPNFLIITVDDMSCDSVGVFGCELEGTTPTIDALASRGIRYHHAHVQVGNCYPSRNVMFSGRYPHNTGVEGFYQVRDPDYPHLVDAMQAAGYFVAIRGKVSHSTPYQPYGWDADLTVLDGERQDMKNAESYYRSTRRGIELAQSANQPFCININISDPHKPFYAMGKGGREVADDNVPSRIYTADEVPIPGFLFDHPDVRRELAHYYSSVRRADDCVAATLRALSESGMQPNTVILFLSDHGMPLPFAKTALWNHSTRTPWIVVWPGVTAPGSVDRTHMISAVDLMPTVLDIADIDPPSGFDGRSFKPTLRGESQPDRDLVFKVYNENAGGNRSPMRSVQSRRFGYLFNPWSDGQRVFRTATTGTLTYRAMVKLAPGDPQMAARLDHFQHNVPEEFYDYQNDPDALHNLIDDPAYGSEIERHRIAMRKFMVDSGDPLLEVFDQREDPAARSAYVEKVQAESDRRRSRRRAGGARKFDDLFTLGIPKSVQPGTSMTIAVRHQLPPQLGEQSFHITLKSARGQRLERIVKQAAGKGTLTVEFMVPKDVVGDHLDVAIFVGKDFAGNLMHRNIGPIPLKRTTDRRP